MRVSVTVMMVKMHLTLNTDTVTKLMFCKKTNTVNTGNT